MCVIIKKKKTVNFFLFLGTRSFVSGLFEALKTKSYINSSTNGMSCVTVPPSSQGATNNYQNSTVLNQSNHGPAAAPQPPPKADRKRKIIDGSDAVSVLRYLFSLICQSIVIVLYYGLLKECSFMFLQEYN